MMMITSTLKKHNNKSWNRGRHKIDFKAHKNKDPEVIIQLLRRRKVTYQVYNDFQKPIMTGIYFMEPGRKILRNPSDCTIFYLNFANKMRNKWLANYP